MENNVIFLNNLIFTETSLTCRVLMVKMLALVAQCRHVARGEGVDCKKAKIKSTQYMFQCRFPFLY